MYRTIEATIDADGTVHLAQPLGLTEPKRALVIVLDETPPNEAALLAEAALAEDWNRPEEDAAWSYLQSGT